MEDKKTKTIRKRIKDQKKEFLAALSELDNISVICKKTGIARATFYRWLEDDINFAKNVGKALKLGKAGLNDLARSGLAQKIKEGNMQAITFQLKNNDPDYMPKLPTKDIETFVPVQTIVLNDASPETLKDWALKVHEEMAEEKKSIPE